MSAEKAKDPRHRLLQREIGDIRDWEDWFHRFHRPQTTQELIGLLHVGPDIPGWSPEFYFEIADGYQHYDFFAHPEPETCTDPKRFKKQRREIARKAFEVLVNRFFKRKHVTFHPSTYWHLAITGEALFKKVIWFLMRSKGPQKLDYYNIPHLASRDHCEHAFLEFISEFVQFVWDFEQTISERHRSKSDACIGGDFKAVCSMFQYARSEILEIANAVEKVDFLTRRKHGVRAYRELDDASLEKLAELAHRDRFGRNGGYRSLETAIADGNRAAEVCLILQAVQSEKARLMAIDEANRKINQAEAELRRVQGC